LSASRIVSSLRNAAAPQALKPLRGGRDIDVLRHAK